MGLLFSTGASAYPLRKLTLVSGKVTPGAVKDAERQFEKHVRASRIANPNVELESHVLSTIWLHYRATGQAITSTSPFGQSGRIWNKVEGHLPAQIAENTPAFGDDNFTLKWGSREQISASVGRRALDMAGLRGLSPTPENVLRATRKLRASWPVSQVKADDPPRADAGLVTGHRRLNLLLDMLDALHPRERVALAMHGDRALIPVFDEKTQRAELWLSRPGSGYEDRRVDARTLGELGIKTQRELDQLIDRAILSIAPEDYR